MCVLVDINTSFMEALSQRQGLFIYLEDAPLTWELTLQAPIVGYPDSADFAASQK